MLGRVVQQLFRVLLCAGVANDIYIYIDIDNGIEVNSRIDAATIFCAFWIVLYT